MLEKRRAVQVGFSMVTKSPFHLHPTMVLDQQSSGSEDSSTLAMCFPGVLHFWYFQFPDSARVAHPSLQFPLGKQSGCLSSGQNSCREWNMEWHEGINLALFSMNNFCCGKMSSNSTQGTLQRDTIVLTWKGLKTNVHVCRPNIRIYWVYLLLYFSPALARGQRPGSLALQWSNLLAWSVASVVFSPRCALNISNHDAFAFCGFFHLLSRHPSISLCITKDSHLRSTESTVVFSICFFGRCQETRLVRSHRLRKLSCPAALPCNRIFLAPPAVQMSGVDRTPCRHAFNRTSPKALDTARPAWKATFNCHMHTLCVRSEFTCDQNLHTHIHIYISRLCIYIIYINIHIHVYYMYIIHMHVWYCLMLFAVDPACRIGFALHPCLAWMKVHANARATAQPGWKKRLWQTTPVAVAKTKTTTSRRKVPKRTRKVYGYDDNDGPQQRYGSEKMAVRQRTMNREVPGDRHFLQWDALDSNGFLECICLFCSTSRLGLVWADQKWIVTYGTHTVWENRKRIDDIGQVQHAQTWTMFGYVWIIAVRKQLSTKTAANRQRWTADSFAASTKMLDSFNSVLRIVEAQTPPGNVLASEIGWSRRENLTWVSVYHIAWCLWRLLWLFSVLCPVMFSKKQPANSWLVDSYRWSWINP